jgi:ABC-2 type transport system permease protein
LNPARSLDPLIALTTAKLRIGRAAIASVRRESKLKVALVSVSTVVLWLGAFGVGRLAFRWLELFGGEMLGAGSLTLGDLVVARLFSLFAFVLFLLLIFSNILVAFGTLYRSREVIYLVAAPLGWRRLFLARFGEGVFLSSWASAFLGSPLLLAYGVEVGAPPLFYLAAVLVYLPFILLPAALGTLVTVLLTRALPRLGAKGLAALGTVLVIGFALVLRRTMAAPELGTGATVGTLMGALAGSESLWLPSHWAARSVLAAAGGQYLTALAFFGLLLAVAALVVVLVTEVAARLFYPGWSSLMGVERRRSPKGSRLQESRPGRLLIPLLTRFFTRPLTRVFSLPLALLREPTRSLVLKDLRLFWRDPSQWGQFVLFFGIMALYAANMRRTSVAYDAALWQSLLTLLNAVVSMLILATLTTRFIFPLISLEGRRFWILGLAPLTKGQLVAQKVGMSIVTTSVFTVGLVLLTSLRLGLGGVQLGVSLVTIVAANFALSGLAVGLGSLYPNFQEDNPARIVSGLGGTLNFILSMLYIVLVGAAQTVALQWPYLQRFGGWRLDQGPVAVLALVFIVAVSGVTFTVPLLLGLRNLSQADF